MTAQSFIQDMVTQGVIIRAAGDHLDVDAPDQVLTDSLLDELRRRKAELVAWLSAIENPEMHDSALFDVVITYHGDGEPRMLVIPQWWEPEGWQPPF